MNRSVFRIWGPSLALVILGFLIAYQFVQPAPPSTLTLGTGSKGGAYFDFGLRYRDILAQEKIDLVLKPSSGSVDNLDALTSGEVDVAFMQGGVAPRPPTKGLTALASLFQEPLWAFMRTDSLDGNDAPRRLQQLHNYRLAIGQNGSGTQQVVLDLMINNDIGPADATLLKIGGRRAADALKAGDVDVAFFVASPKAGIIHELLRDPTLILMSFERAGAYLQTYRFLTSVTLAEGAIDLSTNRPDEDITLLAPVASLVAKDDLHPALVDILIEAAKEVHRDGDIFTPIDRFPATDHLDFPLSSEALRYLNTGPSFLQRYLPFWGANLLDRMAVLLIPALTLLVPMLRLLPPVVDWNTRRRVCRYYSELVDIETKANEGLTENQYRDLLRRIDRIETKVIKLQVPTSRMDLLYTLRVHINLIRGKLEELSPIVPASLSVSPTNQPHLTDRTGLADGEPAERSASGS